MKSISFGYGALCDTLEKQANDQGYTLGKDAEKFEKLKSARLSLLFANVLTEAEMEKTAKRINAKVIKALHPLTENLKDDGIL